MMGPSGQTGAVDVESMQLIASTLTLVVAASTLVIWAAGLSGRGTRLVALVVESRATLTMLIALGATLGSLYFSEVAGYVPCRLCWFQRIAMYPLAVIGAVWLIRGGREGRAYVLPIAAVGALISTYHYLIEWNPSLDSGVCAASGPACSDVWFRSFGFVTLALMALVAFVAIITVNVVSPRSTD
jgi:disulfide bond formation protein DsbB